MKNSIRERNRLERLAAKWPLTYNETYRKYRSKLTSLLRLAKENYYKNELKSNQGNPKSHWKIINCVLGRSSNVKTHQIELKQSCDNVSSKLNDHFLNLGNNESIGYINDIFKKYLPSAPNFSFVLTPTNPTEIEKYINSIKSTSSGIDDISPK